MAGSAGRRLFHELARLCGEGEATALNMDARSAVYVSHIQRRDGQSATAGVCVRSCVVVPL